MLFDLKYPGDATTARRISDRNHVPLNELAKLHTSVVFFRYEIDGVIRRGDLQHDLRITTSELSELRQNHRLRRCPRDDEPYPTRWTLPLLPRFRNRSLNPLQRGREFLQKRRTRRSRRDSSCCSRKQLKSQPFLESTNGVAECGLRNTQACGSSCEATLFRYRRKCRKLA
jgi:hypothetical protein